MTAVPKQRQEYIHAEGRIKRVTHTHYCIKSEQSRFELLSFYLAWPVSDILTDRCTASHYLLVEARDKGEILSLMNNNNNK
jgi:hypothetical protein